MNTRRTSRDERRRALRWLIGLAPLAVSLSGCTSKDHIAERDEGLAIVVPLAKAEVHGSLYLARSDAAGANGGGSKIFLPDLLVALKNTSTGSTVATTKTDLAGHYYFRKQNAGTYQVCWAGTGFVSACSKAFTLAGQTAYPGILGVATTPNTVVGRALLTDGRPCYVQDAFFKINLAGKVTLVDAASGANLTSPIRSNADGYYVLTGFSRTVASGIKARVVCENATAEGAITASHLAGARLDLTLPNASPKIKTVAAWFGPRAVRSALLGKKLDARSTVTDDNGHTVHYMWRTEGGGALPNVDASASSWTLPGEPGRAIAYVLAYDGYGGYAQERIPIAVRTKAEAHFQGKVIDDATRAPIPGATIEVYGTSAGSLGQTSTDGIGNFDVRVDEDASDRYALNVSREGYASLSQIYTADNIGGLYELQKAAMKPFDPHVGVDLVDPRKPNEKRKLFGARIVVPPDSMTSSGPLKGYVATLDPSKKPIPGDYKAVTLAGSDTNLASYGTTFGEFRDAAGNRVNIAPGKSAKVYFTIPQTHVATAPATIPVWSYDEKRGVWQEESKAHLIATPDGPQYEGTATHFSTLNTDIEKGPNAKCLRVRVDPTQLPAGIKLRVTVPTAPAAQQVLEMTLDADEYHAIYRLPNTGNVNLQVIDQAGNPVPNASTDVDMALRPAIVGTNLWPPYPYEECGDSIPVGITLPPYGEAEKGKPYFLTGPFGGFNAPDPSIIAPDDMTAAYYATIDPSSLRTTLGGFWGTNGFDPLTGAGGTRAAFMNFNDLGLGRDMHCLQNVGAGTVACYVTNYGLPDQNPGNATLAHTADKDLAVATVAMEYSAIEGAGAAKLVKFYVYAGGKDTGARINAAVLDAFGPRPVPQVCTVCHGGRYAPADFANPIASDVNLGSSFREFDLNTFKYPPGGHDFPPTVPTGEGSLDDFKALNLMVKATTPAPSISEVIDTWYPGASANPNFVTPVAGWFGAPENALYLDVVANSCRTCHVARDGTLRFDTYDKFAQNRGSIEYLVCLDTPPDRNNKAMPNAAVTYKNFWQTLPSRPAALAAFSHAATAGAPAWGAFGSCQ